MAVKLPAKLLALRRKFAARLAERVGTTAKPCADIAVMGSVNLDLVAYVDQFPLPGETRTDAQFARFPGGKGANQALALQRLARTAPPGSPIPNLHCRLYACVGDDPFATEALAQLRLETVDLDAVEVEPAQPTGTALILVNRISGENQIVVAPGANRACSPTRLLADLADAARPDMVLAQLETPIHALEAIAPFAPFLVLNAAPAKPLPAAIWGHCDLLIVNEIENAFYRDAIKDFDGLVAITHGAKGASLYWRRERLAVHPGFAIEAIDTTGAGDCFTAALLLALMRSDEPFEALRFACAAAACACMKAGAQSSLPDYGEVQAFLASA